ncbi:MAG: tyrosine-protein kinase family protein [Burkholderiales bacterium]|nr:tyrosine-protein kinase family protein [Burkholderiales bacterium]
MSSLIEQAAQRLAQLRRAGIEIPGEDGVAEPAPPVRPTVSPPNAVPSRYSAEASARESAAAARRSVPQPDEPSFVSRQVEIDFDVLTAQNIITPNAARNRTADQFRVIKRPLINNATGKGAASLTHANLIMVTSALPGEGKSYTSVNLAMSIAAELDHTVMLVDADVARPSVLRMLGLPPSPGLLDVLEGKADMSSVLMRTNVDKLTILPSGTPHERATELLASDAMRQLLDDMATRYPDRIIIFDSPPLLLTTESRVLATNMGQIVMVVHAGKTLQADVTHALSTIESCPVKMTVLNKARDSQGAYGYGYSYGYGYGYGQGQGQDRGGEQPSQLPADAASEPPRPSPT